MENLSDSQRTLLRLCFWARVREISSTRGLTNKERMQEIEKVQALAFLFKLGLD